MVRASSWVRAAPNRRSAATRSHAAYSARSPSRSMGHLLPGNHLTPAKSPALELYVLIRRREGVARDEPDPRLFDSWPQATEPGVQPDRRDHGLVVDELLDAVQGGLAPLRVEIARLLQEKPVDVRIASVDVRASGGDEGFDPRRGVAEGSAAALDEPLELPLCPAPEKSHALDRSESHADAGRVQVVDDWLADVRDRGVAEVVAGVEAIRVAGLGQELLGLGGIVRIAGRLPVELEARGNDAPGDPRESQGIGLVHRLPVDGVVRRQAHAPIV